MIWVGGQIVEDHALKISVLDRTFEHGLGLFETFRTWNGHPTLLDRHLARLDRSAKQLGLPLDTGLLPDARAIAELLHANGSTGDAVLRITMSGGRDESGGATLWMRSMPLPPAIRPGGAILGDPERVPLGYGRQLSAFKSLNYWENRIAFQHAQLKGFDECLTVDEFGMMGEGSRTNLFAVCDGELATPGPDHILSGIMRGLILEWAGALDLPVRNHGLSRAELEQAEEVFLTNSGRGIMPVARVGWKDYPSPGPWTTRLWDDVLPWLESGGKTP